MVSNAHPSPGLRRPASITREDWNRQLARPVPINGTTLATLADVRARLLGLSARERGSLAWRHAAVLLVATARAEIVDMQQVTIAVEMAIRLDGRVKPTHRRAD